MAARQERWKGVSLDALASSKANSFFDQSARERSWATTPEKSAIQAEIQSVLQDVIQKDLTDKQRRVVVLMIFHEVPLDEVARYLGSNRNAVYKTLHDARRKLKQGLEQHGFDVREILSIFDPSR
jgi:RNA polymerase sigma-70 factor, ECF subfamily